MNDLVTVERSELERLQALERKIEAFLDWLRDNADVDGIGMDTHATRFSIDLDAVLSQDVMRKAFELFEVSEEQAK